MSIYSTRVLFHKYYVAMQYIWICIFLAKVHLLADDGIYNNKPFTYDLYGPMECVRCVAVEIMTVYHLVKTE